VTTPTPVDHQFINKECPGKTASSAAVDLNLDEARLGEPIGWNPTGPKEGVGQWCEAQGPAADWNLKNFCGHMESKFAAAAAQNKSLSGAAAQIKVLTYNLEWWANYQQWPHPGGNTINPALGENIVKDAKIQGFDLMGFQECEGVDIIVDSAKKAGLPGNWGTSGVHEGKSIGICIAYNTDTFSFIAQGNDFVGEDQPGAHWYGKRKAQWVRLAHKASGQTVFYLNHHGPIPINTGGKCGAKATAWNILKIIGQNAQKGDLIFMTCDCNAWAMYGSGKGNVQGPWTYQQEIGQLACHLPHMFANSLAGPEDIWGIDNMFSNCAKPAKQPSTVLTSGTVMGKGGSDHHALSLVYDMPGAGQATETVV